jgi:hypothetical protein
VNPLYSLQESPHRWLILGGLTFLVALLGAMVSLAYGWPYWLGRTWFWLGASITVVFLVLAFVEWKRRVDASEVAVERQE